MLAVLVEEGFGVVHFVSITDISGKTLRHEFSLHYISVFSVDSVFKKFFLSMTEGLVTYKKFQSECLHANRA